MKIFLPKFLGKFHVKIVAILIFSKMVVLDIARSVFYSVGRVFIKEITFKDRCCFRQKCIYKREYHYQNKIEEINKNFGLEMSSQEKYELLLKLQKIDKVMEKINEKGKRKRLINITHLIKRVLSEYYKTRADKTQLHLSEKILKFYDEWYNNFQKTQ